MKYLEKEVAYWKSVMFYNAMGAIVKTTIITKILQYFIRINQVNQINIQ